MPLRIPIPNLLALIVLAQHASAVSTLRLATTTDACVKEPTKHDVAFIVEACLIPVLVILSGVLAGLTLGYMSLDETQLRVLSLSGTPKQRAYALRIEPIRKNGHLLLTTLLLGNMIVNETLPVLSEKVLGGGIQAVVVSTVLIVVFSEIIPQSLCSRFGLQIGAFMAVPTQYLIYLMFVVSWPIAKLLEFALGPHHGIVYRRNELKELVRMHHSMSDHGGDLQSDTVTMVGGALDFQEKIVRDAMTPIERVFMLPIDSKLDYETLARVVRSGHSRVPVYEEVKEISGGVGKKIIGVLLVKQCVLLDPEDATPLRDIPLNTLPTVPFDEPLLMLLDRFQQGNSHLAVVSRIPSKIESKAKPGSVNEEAKGGFTRRFLNRVGLGESSDDNDSDEEGSDSKSKNSEKARKKKAKHETQEQTPEQPPAGNWMNWNKSVALEQTMPSDAVLTNANAEKYFEGLQRAPLGIITLEDLIEELIGEEILDEYDLEGNNAASTFVPAEAQRAVDAAAEKNALAEAERRATAEVKFAPIPVSGSTTPIGGSTANLRNNPRVVQGLRAIRNAANVVGGPKPKTKRSSSAPGTNRKPLSPLTGATTPGGGGASGAATPMVTHATLADEETVPSTPGVTVVPAPETPSAPLAGGGALGGGSTLLPPTASTPILGGAGIPQPGTPKKRAFKSLIAGEGATPGLDKRSDPLAKEGAGGE